jgi:chemotaxis protein methyltransferase CheR
MNVCEDRELEVLEIQLLLEGVFRCYGFDFRDYAFSSLRRRVWNAIRSEGLSTISGLQEKILHDPACWHRFLMAVTVNVTAMFRDPGFYRTFRRKVIPLLRDEPFIRIWHAGCATGEEVYSLAILLQEEDLYDHCRIYATDMNEDVLERARSGIYPLATMESHADDYLASGGIRSLEDYYTAKYDNAIVRSSLRERVLFAQHNLVTDGSFNEFNVILCRNVMIYFNKPLQDRVHQLIYNSLGQYGVLGLGQKESLRYSPCEERYSPLEEDERLYQRII